MTDPFRFAVEHKPVPKPRMTQSDKWKKRPEVVRFLAYKDALRAAVIDTRRMIGKSDDWLMKGPVEVQMIVGKKFTYVTVVEVPAIDERKRPAGDIDNFAKSVLEALQAEYSLIKDDKQVVRLVAEFDL